MAGVPPMVGSSQPVQEGPPTDHLGGPLSCPIAPILWDMPLPTWAQRLVMLRGCGAGYISSYTRPAPLEAGECRQHFPASFVLFRRARMDSKGLQHRS